MSRKYPRFLFSDPKNTKSKGPFVVHLLHPRMICKFKCNRTEDQQGHEIDNFSVELLEVFDVATNAEVNKTMEEMNNWAWLNS